MKNRLIDARPIVIKYGGSLLEEPAHRRDFLKQIAALAKKEKVVLVHGGGNEISNCAQVNVNILAYALLY